MYSIYIDYQTGDSFHTEECCDAVGHVWNNVAIAKIALQYIKEHYKAVEDIPHDEKRFLKKYGKEPWCKDEYPFFGLAVPTDDGGEAYISCFWCGYFEHLHSATIKIDVDIDDGMSFSTGY